MPKSATLTKRGKPLTAYTGTEDQHSIYLMNQLRLLSARYPLLAHVYHIPNEMNAGDWVAEKEEIGRLEQALGSRKAAYSASSMRRRRVARLARQVAKGVKRGVFDYHLSAPRGGYASLYVELKVDDGTLTDDQVAYARFAVSEGNLVAVAWDWARAAEVFEWYAGLGKEPVEPPVIPRVRWLNLTPEAEWKRPPKRPHPTPE